MNITTSITNLHNGYQQESDPYTQHLLIADYLMRVFPEKHERWVLVHIVDQGSIQIGSLQKNVLCPFAVSRRSGALKNWIDPALKKLREEKVVAFLSIDGDKAKSYQLTKIASFLEEWWEAGVWQNDVVLGINEWWNPKQQVVTS